jgi:hypothetical protein
MQLDVGCDVILCLMVIGRAEATQEWALHGYLDRGPDYRDAMYVSAFAVAEWIGSRIGWLARWGRLQSAELLLKQVTLSLIVKIARG